MNFFKEQYYSIGKSPFKWLISVTLILSFFVFDDFWVALINKIWVEPVASQLHNQVWWITSVYAVLIFLYYHFEYITTETVNAIRRNVVVYSTFLYGICLFSGRWDYALMCDGCKYLAWSNLIFLIPVAGELLLFCRSRRSMANNLGASLEIEKTQDVTDSYGRHEVCLSTYETLQSCFYKEGSFTFSIIGAWGSGKTTYMNNLKELYKTGNYSIIEFEPWKNDTPDSIIRSFFSLLSNELSIYIPNISSAFDEYIDILLDEESKTTIKIVGKSLYKIFSEEITPYERIKKELETTQHKTVVFIDDIDRLNAEEIKEVLRLIRNTANFPYIQFIVAYDKDYVCNALVENKICNPNLYLEKFFNVELVLPKSEDRVICSELISRFKLTINRIWKVDQDDVKISSMINYRIEDPTNSIISNCLIPKILRTIRDVIRFHNSFYLVANAYKNQGIEKEIEFQDLFFLELLQYKYRDIYSVLCNTPLKLLELNNYSFSLKDKCKTTVSYILNNTGDTGDTDDTHDADRVISVLERLFRYTGNRFYGIYNLRSYDKYFMYRLDDKILTVGEFMSLMDKDDSTIISSADELYRKKYSLEFEQQIDEILRQIENISIRSEDDNTFDYVSVYNLLRILTKSRNQSLKNEVFNAVISHLERFNCIDNSHFKAFLNLYDIVDFSLVTTRIFNIGGFLSVILFKDNLNKRLKHNINGPEVAEIVLDFLSNTSHPEIISPALTSFINDCKKGSIKRDRLLIDLSTISNIQLKYFENIKEKFSSDGFTLFYNCRSKVDPKTNRVSLRPEALKIMKKAIMGNPDGYFRSFIRSGYTSNPQFNRLSPEPYYDDMFGGNDEFESFLAQCNSQTQYEKRVKNFWELYKYNGYKPIEFQGQGDVKEKIDTNFESEIVLLEQLKDIEREISDTGVVSEEMIRMFNDNHLYIRLRGKIDKMIKEYASQKSI